MFPPLADLIIQDVDDFFVLDPKIAHGDGGTGMVEPFADDFKADSIFCALDIAPCYGTCYGTVIQFNISSAVVYAIDCYYAEKSKIDDSGALHHIICRVNERGDIFTDNAELKTANEVKERKGR